MDIYKSIAAIMAEGTAVGKDDKNPQQGYKYRSIDAVMNAFSPLLAKYKVCTVPEVLSQEREERQTSKGGLLLYSILKVKYTFFAEDGTSISATVIGEGMDSGDKSSNKAMSAAYKYALFQVFCIPTEEMIDSETESPEPAPKQATSKKPAEAPKPATKPAEQPAPEPPKQAEQPAQQAAQPKGYCWVCKKPIYSMKDGCARKDNNDEIYFLCNEHKAERK